MRRKTRTPTFKQERPSKRTPIRSPKSREKEPSPHRVMDQLWVKHPPIGTWMVTELNRLPNGYVTWKNGTSNDDALKHFARVENPTDEFRETRSPLAGIQAFVGAHRRGLYPDTHVLEWLSQILEQYGASEGKISLDDLLGLRKKKGPRTDVFSKSKQHERDHWLCVHMCILIQGFRLGVKEAAPAVAEAFKDRIQGIQTLAAGEIANRFGRVPWKAFRKRYAESPIHEGWSETEKRAYLLQYPISALPPRLHNLMQASS